VKFARENVARNNLEQKIEGIVHKNSSFQGYIAQYHNMKSANILVKVPTAKFNLINISGYHSWSLSILY
jgi:hypothetical protein